MQLLFPICMQLTMQKPAHNIWSEELCELKCRHVTSPDSSCALSDFLPSLVRKCDSNRPASHSNKLSFTFQSPNEIGSPRQFGLLPAETGLRPQSVSDRRLWRWYAHTLARTTEHDPWLLKTIGNNSRSAKIVDLYLHTPHLKLIGKESAMTSIPEEINKARRVIELRSLTSMRYGNVLPLTGIETSFFFSPTD